MNIMCTFSVAAMLVTVAVVDMTHSMAHSSLLYRSLSVVLATAVLS